MKPWMRLSTYMKVMNGIRGIPIKENNVFTFNDSEAWEPHVKASAITLKTANIVMFDRWSAKRALAD